MKILQKLNSWFGTNIYSSGFPNKFYERWHSITSWFRYSWLGRKWYWFTSTYIRKYHIIDIRGQDGYTHGWIDKDRVLFLAAFKCLVDFIEGEQPIQCSDDELDPECGLAQLRSLYEWWKFGRQKEHEEVARILSDFNDEFKKQWGDVDFLDELGRSEIPTWRYNHPLWKEWSARSDKLEERDDEQLALLVKWRKHMWT